MPFPFFRAAAFATGFTAARLAATVTSTVAGQMTDGRPITSYTLTNSHGLRVKVLDYGTILTSVETPDKFGRLADVTLGYDSLAGYLVNRPHFGATVGRVANRISYGHLVLDGKTYQLPTNSEAGGVPAQIHGGKLGFDRRLWTGRILKDANAVEFSYVSADGEEGYPGTMTVSQTIILNENNELRIIYLATTNKDTVVNLTNHTYWNLTGDQHNKILRESIQINADQFLPMNQGHVPTGQINSVEATPFDFRTAKVIGDQILIPNDQITLGGGFDHCWVLPRSNGVRLAARLTDPDSGRILELSTDQPGVQFYTANSLDDRTVGKNGAIQRPKTAVCLEPERFPDSPNQPRFPSAELRPGETYRQTMIWHFSVATN